MTFTAEIAECHSTGTTSTEFLQDTSAAIRGTCLEVQDAYYCRIYGDGRVTRQDVVDIDRTNPLATFYGDLRALPEVADDTYDCIVLTQVLQYIDDTESAIRECHRILKPGGVLLAVVPAVCRIDCRARVQGDYWRFTKAGAEYLFRSSSGPAASR